MTIKCWKVNCGDAITIRSVTNEGRAVNLFIDGGYLGTYRDTIRKEIKWLQEEGEVIDRWIITHTDRDHIGGVIAFLRDSGIRNKEALIKEFWFNWSSYPYKLPSNLLSTEQGMTLRDYLRETGNLSEEDIVAGAVEDDWHGLHIKILSPNRQKLNASKLAWAEDESELMVSADLSDYNKTIEELQAEPFEEDTDVYNGSSIAILLEKGSFRVLLLGDAHPSVIIESLQKLGYSKENKLSVDYIKLSHHGSRRNFSPHLLELVSCNNFILLGNGISHKLPNKWTLAQILTSAQRTEEPVNFYFNDNSDELKNMFSVDEDVNKYAFNCHFTDTSCLIIELLDQ
ncbi:ComEC/Rec2 family competence protein [Chitinophaga varians]|uniref:ComEC/Rec2 family competence protein n=1 Tax=Chitinophaga varians TaxID=2202339 RepID=UPI00165FCFCD|nr:MBL fold metallo-hydrolase [Chitinophaga varians]MBC9909831.1 hypothetical protein [Chitinophaga varians]